MIDLIASICDAGRECLPQTGGKPPENKNEPDAIVKVLPGWKEHVAPYRDKAVFWFRVWRGVPELIQDSVFSKNASGKNVLSEDALFNTAIS